MKHKVKARDYKIKYGLRIKDGLMSPIAKLDAQERYNTYVREHNIKTDFHAMSKKGRAILKKKGYKPGGKDWTPQKRNERGSCKDQTLAKLQYIGKKNGGVITQPAFCELYGAVDTVLHWFGSWAAGVKAAGFNTYQEITIVARDDRREQAREALQKFFLEYGRTPQWSDFNTFDSLPSPGNLHTLYPTLNLARFDAEVPLLICPLGGRKWEEVPLGKEEPWMLEGRADGNRKFARHA